MQTGVSYLHLFASWTSECDFQIMLTCFEGSDCSDWLQTSVGTAHLISPTFCFFDIWVHMFASSDCESRPAMANSWLITPSVCFLDIWVKSLDHADICLLIANTKKIASCVYGRLLLFKSESAFQVEVAWLHMKLVLLSFRWPDQCTLCRTLYCWPVIWCRGQS